MSPKKIIFFVIIVSSLLGILGGIYYISGQSQVKKTSTKNLTIWINEGTTSSYETLIAGFKQYAPEYSKTDIKIEKQSNNPDTYRLLLLSSISDGNGPDIFMLHSGEDTLLENRIEPIPSSRIDMSIFDTNYDAVFTGLLTSTGSGKEKITLLKGVPLGYETLGVFINKSLMREAPRTWNDLDRIALDMPAGIYASNLGLGPIYTPNMVDILPIWLSDTDGGGYRNISTDASGLSRYLEYASMPSSVASSPDIVGNEPISIERERSSMISQKESTLDMFVQGKIAMVVGYPSLISDLEKSIKRSGEKASGGIILADRLPQMNNQSQRSIGRYSYFAISRSSQHGDAALKWLEYLMTAEAQQLYMNEYPYMIPAQSSFYAAAEQSSLSPLLTRTRLAPFIPKIGDIVSVYDYGIKSHYERILREGLDIGTNTDVDAIANKIALEIGCEIRTGVDTTTSGDCNE